MSLRISQAKIKKTTPDTFGLCHDTFGRCHFCTLLADQRHGGGFAAGNFRTCAMHAAAMATVPELKPSYRRLFSAHSARRHAHPIEQRANYRAHRTISDGDQTGFHAIPALQTAASMTAVSTSVLYSQTSGQDGVLQRATFATVQYMRRRW